VVWVDAHIIVPGLGSPAAARTRHPHHSQQNGGLRMKALTPAMVHEVACLVTALAMLIRAIRPHGR